MIKPLPYLVTLFAIVAFTGCSPLITPTAYQVPALAKAGDAQLDVIGGISTFNAQLAYSPVNHLALAVTANRWGTNNSTSHYNDHTTFGIGYYGKKTEFQFSIYGRYGYGTSADDSFSDATQTYYMAHTTTISYKDYQIQPTFNFIDEDYEIYTGVRASSINTTSFFTNDKSRFSPGNTFTAEPFVGGRRGWDNLKFEIQAGYYFHGATHAPDAGATTRDQTVNINVGISYSFNIHKKHFGINN
jgi:hypothetical protein